MLESLRMQEVSQIVLSVPVGAVIPGKNYSVGEPIMIILRIIGFLCRLHYIIGYYLLFISLFCSSAGYISFQKNTPFSVAVFSMEYLFSSASRRLAAPSAPSKKHGSYPSAAQTALLANGK